MMRIHILGICGTFMGGLALFAKQLGHDVNGSNQNIYPPMSLLLESSGIENTNRYYSQQLSQVPDAIIIGNTISRGNECVEDILNKELEYTSGPQ